MPSPITWPLSKGLRYAIRAAAAGLTLYEHLFDGIDAGPSNLEWRKLVVRFQRTPVDDAVCSWDLLNITSSAVDNTWTTGDYTACEGPMTTFLTALKPFMSTQTQAVEYRWYRMAYRDDTDPKPFVPSVVPERLTPVAIAGTGSTAYYPRQTCNVLTELTPLPHHWGRTYLPHDGSTPGLQSNGQINLASVLTPSLTAAKTMYAAWWAANFVPVVPVTKVDRDVNRFLLPVTQLRMDSVPDIQRRRRTNTPTDVITQNL